jgi:hypothetical protein
MRNSNYPSLCVLMLFSSGAAIGCTGGEGWDATGDSLPLDDEAGQEGAFAAAAASTHAALDADLSEADLEVLLPPVAVPGEGRDVSGLTLGPTYTEYPLPAQGGWGGTFTGHAGSGVMYAVKVRSGAYVDSLRIAYYLPSNPDNRFRNGDFYGEIGPFGGSGGADNPWVSCPAGQGVLGIRGASGSLVDRLSIICGDVTNPDPWSSSNFLSGFYGGGGGGWFDTRCAPGYLLDAFNLRSGNYVDQIQGVCIRAR